jgi:hypothetical protein
MQGTLRRGRIGGRWTNNKASHHPTVEDQHLKQSPLYSHFFLSQLVTPTQALRCKEIQYSPLPAGRRAFFCPNQDKPLCTLLASPSRLGTHSIDSLIGLGSSQDRTLTVGVPGRGRCVPTSFSHHFSGWLTLNVHSHWPR